VPGAPASGVGEVVLGIVLADALEPEAPAFGGSAARLGLDEED
jgi:hypothetical protein